MSAKKLTLQDFLNEFTDKTVYQQYLRDLPLGSEVWVNVPFRGLVMGIKHGDNLTTLHVELDGDDKITSWDLERCKDEHILMLEKIWGE